MDYILKGGKGNAGKPGGAGAGAGGMGRLVATGGSPMRGPGQGGAAGAGGAGPVGAADLVSDSDTAHFVADVIDASRTVPVIVDMWAPWCGPCKQLGPLLEKLVRQAAGAVRMVKINVDENQQLAAQLRVQSIPAVFAFKNGALVDGFVGGLPESQIKAFIARLTGGKGSIVDEALAEAKALFDDGHVEDAELVYRDVLAQDQANPAALAGVLRCFIARGEVTMAEELVSQLPADLLAKPEIAAVKTQLELAANAPDQGALRDLEGRVAADASDHQARFDLALALFAAGDRARAVEELLDIVRRDRGWNDDGARKQLVKLFEAMGPTDPLTLQGRRRLSSVLFS